MTPLFWIHDTEYRDRKAAHTLPSMPVLAVDIRGETACCSTYLLIQESALYGGLKTVLADRYYVCLGADCDPRCSKRRGIKW